MLGCKVFYRCWILYLQVYHAFYKPLEFYLPGTDSSECYIKVRLVIGDSLGGWRGDGCWRGGEGQGWLPVQDNGS